MASDLASAEQLTSRIIAEIPNSARNHPIIVYEAFVDVVNESTSELEHTNADQGTLATNLADSLSTTKATVLQRTI